MPPRQIMGADGHTWHAYVVVEGMKLGPINQARRRNWLCLETTGERRYISPIPPEWEQWTDAQLRAAIAIARPDLRS